ncbi:MAG: hypothetical protein QOH58_3031 [Thermoleophilaceae bacterium]|jgi:hypothetical protein|nr:hypothetical protein [Thermoleophilaceae bacterium]
MTVQTVRELQQRHWAIAAGLSQLLEDPSGWRHRRSERFELRSAEEVRRHVSIDFTVPSEVWDDLLLRPREKDGEGGVDNEPHRSAVRTGREGQWVIPLGWLARGQLVGFDLRQDGSSLPLLLASEIEVVTRDLLELELSLCLGTSPSRTASDLTARAFELIRRCVEMDVAAGLESDIDRFAEDYGDVVSSLVELMRASASGFLLLVLVPRVDRRQLVKFAFDEPVPRDGPRSVIFFDTPGVLEAASSHLECPLPVELRAEAWFMLETGTRRVLSPVVEDSHHPSLYVTADGLQQHLDRLEADGQAGSRLGVRAQHIVEGWRFHHPAIGLSVLAGLTIAYGAWIADLNTTTSEGRQGPVVTLLLAGIALFVALLLRLDEHSTARAMLRRSRSLLSGVLLSVLAAAAALAFAGEHTTAVWCWISGVLGLLVAALVWTSRRVRTGTRG